MCDSPPPPPFPLNIFNYTFPPITSSILEYGKTRASLGVVAAHFGFEKRTINIRTSKWPHEYSRILYFNLKDGLILKTMQCKEKPEGFQYLCPTLTYNTRSGRKVYIQPICDQGIEEERRKWSEIFKKELPNNDLHSSNVLFLKGLPALIDW